MRQIESVIMARKNSGQNNSASAKKSRGNIANLKPWPKGVSGNPTGRPKASVVLSEAYRRALAEPLPNDKTGATVAAGIAHALVMAALDGDVSAARELADRTEGKARQAIDVAMSLLDWRQMAESQGLSPEDVLTEARLLLVESADDSSGDDGGRAA